MTPGYLPRSLPSGLWIVQIDTHMIMPGEALHYTLDISLALAASTSSEAPRLQRPGKPPQRGAGWYRGGAMIRTCGSPSGRVT